MHLFDLFINILTFLFIYLIIFSSISGYGIVFSSVINYSLKNIFDSYFIGLAIVTLFSFIIYLTFGFNDYFNILFLLIGVFFFIRKKKSEQTDTRDTGRVVLECGWVCTEVCEALA